MEIDKHEENESTQQDFELAFGETEASKLTSKLKLTKIFRAVTVY